MIIANFPREEEVFSTRKAINMYPYQIKSLEAYHQAYQKSVDQPEEFWAEIAENFVWKKKWDTVLKWDFDTPSVKWFEGGKLNITENCLDRHLEALGEKTAILWEPNNPEEAAKHISYKELHQRVSQFSNVLKSFGIKKGDRVCLYMPMVPELTIAVMACARIGAIHSVVFGGFSLAIFSYLTIFLFLSKILFKESKFLKTLICFYI